MEDGPRLKEMMDRFDGGLSEAIGADETDDGFIYQMFLYELDIHEYGYTMDTEDALDALGYTAEEILGNPQLKRGIEKAFTEICKRKRKRLRNFTIPESLSQSTIHPEPWALASHTSK